MTTWSSGESRVRPPAPEGSCDMNGPGPTTKRSEPTVHQSARCGRNLIPENHYSRGGNRAVLGVADPPATPPIADLRSCECSSAHGQSCEPKCAVRRTDAHQCHRR